MPVTVLLKMTTKPGSGDELVELLEQILPDTRSFDGCLDLRVLRNLDDPDEITLLQKWEAREKHQAYSAWRAAVETGKRMAHLLAEQPKAVCYAQLAEVEPV